MARVRSRTGSTFVPLDTHATTPKPRATVPLTQRPVSWSCQSQLLVVFISLCFCAPENDFSVTLKSELTLEAVFTVRVQRNVPDFCRSLRHRG